jgi:hypothetical protein
MKIGSLELTTEKQRKDSEVMRDLGAKVVSLADKIEHYEKNQKLDRSTVPGHVAESGDFPPDFFNDPNFIPANSGTGYSLYPLNYFRACAQAERLSQANPFYHRVIEIHRDHICGQGYEIEAKATDASLADVIPCIQTLCNENWSGDINQADLRYQQWVYECNMTGMLCLTANVNHVTGFLEYGDLPARWITDLSVNPYNSSDVTSVKTQPGDWIPGKKVGPISKIDINGVERKAWGDPTQYQVIRMNRYEWELDEKAKPRIDPETNLPIANTDYGSLTGDVFLLRTGNLRGQKFGQGDGFHIHDLCTELDQIIFLFRRAYEIQLNVVMEFNYKNVADDDLDDKAKMIVPTAPLPLATNENVSFKMHSPQLNPQDLNQLVETLGRFIAGVMGIPEFMMGNGANTNRSAGDLQTGPMYQKFNVRRKQFEYFFSFMLRYYIQEANKRGMLYHTISNADGTTTKGGTAKLTKEQLKQIDINWKFLPYEKNNVKDQAMALKDLADALTALLQLHFSDDAGQQRAILDGATVQDIVFGALSSLGYTVNREAVAAKAGTVDAMTNVGQANKPISAQDLA